nr:ProQ/FinO family protein [Legionella micdadei]
MRRQELHPRTAVINKTQKNKSKKARNEALSWLAVTFPQVFDNSLRIRPLKTGIMHDILAYADKAQEAGISKSKLREAVVLFTRRIDYLTCLKAREMRIDLDGNPVAMVTEEEAERAAVKIKKRVEKSARNARKNLLSKVPNQSSRLSQPGFQPSQEIIPLFQSALLLTACKMLLCKRRVPLP